jgi:galactose-1-phosphate uridylyltransferase
MSKLSFKTQTQTSSFYNPLQKGAFDTQTLEIRSDPLTGHQSVLNSGLEGKAHILFPETDFNYLEQRNIDTQESCFLCHNTWQDNIPCYAHELIPEGILHHGEASLFPNLFPVAAYHAVVRVGDRHFRQLNEFSKQLLQDGLTASTLFLKRCYDYDPSIRFCSINANYLFPAGASVIHPHFQVLASPTPPTHHQKLLECCQRYFQKNHSCFWTDLLDEEQKNTSRWLGSIGPTRWITAFSPLGPNEVQAIWPEKKSFLEWTEEDLSAWAQGLEWILKSYHELKLSSFNFSCFSGPFGEASPEFRCFFRIINRQNAVPHHRTDDYFLQRLLQNELIINRPEHLCSWMREWYFNK